MITCPACAAEAGPDQRFCGQCGTSLTGRCPACDADYGPGQRFCGQCGTTIGVPPSEQEPAVTPEDSPVIAERRIVSVMFVDLVGFTTLSEGRDPEDVRSLITEYFELAQGIVDRFGGTVDKFIGDAVMAWWGATASQEDDAERAVRAALEIVDRVSSLGDRVGITDLAARAGVMTGEASVGPGGNQKGLLLGDLVNSASRVQSIAQPATVLVGAVTADLVAGSIDLTEGGTHTVKGKEDPIVVFQALRTAAERGGRGRADGLEPPFVGRTSELRLLKDTLHAITSDQRARLVSLVGQAGIGKSRLIWEFRKYIDGLVENVYWHEGRSPSYGDRIALWALAEMIRHRARIQETDDEETTRRLLAVSMDEHVPDPTEREWIGARLAGLLGVGESTGHDREELFAAARAFFERLALKGTVVLVFEDLQWADASLLEFIEDLPDWSLNHPILVVTMTRPDLLERRPDWGSGRRGFTSLYIGPLTDPEMTELIEGTIAEIPSAISQRIVGAAGGVPLFAVEMLRMLIGEGRLGGDGDAVTNADAIELEIPTSVQAVISARLDRLPHDDREVARDAAVLGYSFTVDGLAAVRDESIDKVERRLSDLVRREILELVRDPLSPERGHYRWVQSLVREVAYGRIARADRQTLHLRAARYFRDLEDSELAPVAAAHFVAAGEGAPDPALEAEMVEALQRAIQRAHAVHGHEQVLSLVDTSLELIPVVARADLHEIAAEAAVKIQDNQAADRHVEALAEIAEHQPALLHRAVALRGWVGNETRRSESARQTMEDHLTAHPDPGNDPDLARVAVYLARARMLGGDIESGAQLAHEALGTVEKLGMIEENVDALVTLGTGLSTTRINQGMVILRGALDLARKAGLVGTTLRALINIGFASPDPEEVLEATRQAHLEARRVGDKSHGLFAVNNLLEAYLLNLELDEVARLLDDPLTSNPPPVDAVSLAVSRSLLALRLGDRQEADRQGALARESANDLDDPQVHDQLNFLQFYFLMDDMRFESAFAQQSDLSHVTFTPWAHAGAATEAASMCADPEIIRQALEMWDNLPTGPRRDRFTRWLDVLLSISRGNDADAGQLREVADELRGERLALVAVTALVSGARNLPAGHPLGEELAAEARNVASAAGAAGLADWIDRL